MRPPQATSAVNTQPHVIEHPSAPRRPLGALCFNVETRTRNAKLLLLAMATFGTVDKQTCEARRRNLQFGCHMAHRTFKYALVELIEIGAVKVVKRRGEGGRQADSHYHLTPEDAPQIDWPRPQPALKMGPTPLGMSVPPGDSRGHERAQTPGHERAHLKEPGIKKGEPQTHTAADAVPPLRARPTDGQQQQRDRTNRDRDRKDGLIAWLRTNARRHAVDLEGAAGQELDEAGLQALDVATLQDMADQVRGVMRAEVVR